MKEKRKFLGYYNYTVILTYMGMMSGVVGTIFACGGKLQRSVVAIIISGICDIFDGTIARMRKRTDRERSFGIQIDSMSDLICFGVLPAMILAFNCDKSKLSIAISVIYVLSAMIRLAYFNVDEQERQKTTEDSREIYYGLPVTLASAVVPIIYVFSKCFGFEIKYILSVVLLLMALLFLVPIELRKPKFLVKNGAENESR